MSEQTQWIKETESRRSRVDISGEGVLVASTCGPEGSEVGAVVSHQEFIDGKYQDVIRKVYGTDVLEQMIVGCRDILETRQGA